MRQLNKPKASMSIVRMCPTPENYRTHSKMISRPIKSATRRSVSMCSHHTSEGSQVIVEGSPVPQIHWDCLDAMQRKLMEKGCNINFKDKSKVNQF
jgi:hypothetical protein